MHIVYFDAEMDKKCLCTASDFLFHKLLSKGASGLQFECPRPQRVVSATPRCSEGMYYSCEVSYSSESVFFYIIDRHVHSVAQRLVMNYGDNYAFFGILL